MLLDHEVIMEEAGKWDRLKYDVDDDDNGNESKEESKEESKSGNESKSRGVTARGTSRRM